MVHKNVFFLLVILIICLVIITILRKRRFSTTLQLLTHTLLYLIEIVVATTIITYLISVPQPSTRHISFVNVLRDYLFSYTLYQLILLVTFKLKDTLDIDAYTVIKSQVDKYQIYAEFNRKVPIAEIEKHQEVTNSTKTVLTNKQRKCLEDLLRVVEAYNNNQITTDDFRFILKQESREVDLQTKIVNYGWMNSVLLRILK